ncbi:hypothetical protein ACWOBW_09100 [Gemella sanguinis]
MDFIEKLLIYTFLFIIIFSITYLLVIIILRFFCEIIKTIHGLIKNCECPKVESALKKIKEGVGKKWNKIAIEKYKQRIKDSWEILLREERTKTNKYLCITFILYVISCSIFIQDFNILLFYLSIFKGIILFFLISVFIKVIITLIKEVLQFFNKVKGEKIEEEMQFVKGIKELINGGNSIKIRKLLQYTREIPPEKLAIILREFSVPDLNKLKYILQKDIEQRTIKINWNVIIKIVTIVASLIGGEKAIGYMNHAEQSNIAANISALLFIFIILITNFIYSVIVDDIPISSKYLLLQVDYIIDIKEKGARKSIKQVSKLKLNRQYRKRI